ncbi:uncharacterized protein LOC107465584 [Arachis duranensis]|uniref:Uncharacterized protein LOC107465584 n=1 Tax=Arachis duranensis TaxID=130453 RepID=A0A6P4BCJ6_ARADU|nr:uncharacterized protein LOC107465584 [Arachis duranensis]
MPFGLKNAGATYQRLMNKVFAYHIGKLMEVYVDDMLVKTQNEESLLSDLTKVFDTIRKHVELSEFDLKYEAQTAIKSKYLANFIAEYIDTPGTSTKWNLYVVAPQTRLGVAQAEYEALLAGLRLAREVGLQKLTIFSDSQVDTSQIEGNYLAKDPTLKKYIEKTREQLRQFGGYEV